MFGQPKRNAGATADAVAAFTGTTLVSPASSLQPVRSCIDDPVQEVQMANDISMPVDCICICICI